MENSYTYCVLYDRHCINCGECNLCDLDKSKICDNCCKCIDKDVDYYRIDIDDIIMEEEWDEEKERVEDEEWLKDDKEWDGFDEEWIGDNEEWEEFDEE